MNAALRSLVPLVHVKSVPRSLAFYEKLGFTLRNSFAPAGETEPAWASLESGGACLMLARADESVVPLQQAVLFYVYCEDVPGLRTKLQDDGVPVGPIQHPFYAPGGEFRIEDPDGFVLMVTHT